MDNYALISKLREKELQGISAVLGFDACIDNIIRIVRGREESGKSFYFDNSREFGEFLLNNVNISCGVELETRVSKIGGNMVIMSNALGNLGIATHCIGTFGFPDIIPVFRTMSPNCSLYTVGETITASAIEFNDSKKIMFDPGPYNYLKWDDIKSRLGFETLLRLFSGRQLISLVNWSEIANSSEIWKGILGDILPSLPLSGKQPFVFVDFSDYSRRPADEIMDAISILGEFRKFMPVTISLNQNEASFLGRVLQIPGHLPDADYLKKLFNQLSTDELILHRTKDALAYDGAEVVSAGTFYCPEPKILTGGGDNFNAGFCFGKLSGFNPADCLLLANALSGFYVRNAKSASRLELADFLEQAAM